MLRPATVPRYPRDGARLLLDGERRDPRDATMTALAEELAPGDLVVLNDAATLPGSLMAWLGTDSASGMRLELRLAGPPDEGRVRAVLFGAGDWRLDTLTRPLPPPLEAGQLLHLSDGAPATAVGVDPSHPRLVELDLGPDAWRRIYRLGRPVQYRHLEEPLALWAVQTLFAGLPWAAEMPSAGRPLSWRTLTDLRDRGVEVATLTHAAGLSATGDAALDAALPLPERYRIPAATVAAIEATRRRGGRILAVGTTVVRALEDAHRTHDRLVAGDGMATLRIGTEHCLAVVDGLLTGMHVPGESHYDLLGAFLSPAEARRLHAHAAREDYLAHEFGDLALIWAESGRVTPRACYGASRQQRKPTS